MDARAQVAGDLRDRVLAALRDRLLVGQDARRPLPAGGQARATARITARLLGPARALVGDVRVVVVVPRRPGEDATVNVRWTRNAFGFWYVKTVAVGPVADAAEADLAALDMVLTAVGWTAHGSVPLRSMNRAFPKVRKGRGDA